jgi:hypothetical protein
MNYIILVFTLHNNNFLFIYSRSKLKLAKGQFAMD